MGEQTLWMGKGRGGQTEVGLRNKRMDVQIDRLMVRWIGA